MGGEGGEKGVGAGVDGVSWCLVDGGLGEAVRRIRHGRTLTGGEDLMKPLSLGLSEHIQP